MIFILIGILSLWHINGRERLTQELGLTGLFG